MILLSVFSLHLVAPNSVDEAQGKVGKNNTTLIAPRKEVDAPPVKKKYSASNNGPLCHIYV